MPKTLIKKNVHLTDADPLRLWGVNHIYFNEIKKVLNHLKVHVRGDILTVEGKPQEVERFEKQFMLYKTYMSHEKLADVDTIRGFFSNDINHAFMTENKENVKLLHDYNGKVIRPKTTCQHHFVNQIYANDIVFVTGPAGTGKTYIATVLAVKFLKERLVDKIIITRPVVEAGESLGFLPGDLQEKINPYLRPIFDSLGSILSPLKLKKYVESEVIEIAPLAYMRGRTLNNSFVILDEGQNTTINQMKMLLTRLGSNIKCVVTGDMTQIDLPPKVSSGLPHAIDVLKEIDGIGFIPFSDKDIVRHPLVQKIVRAYAHSKTNR